MTADAIPPAPPEVTAENVEEVLLAAGHKPSDFGLMSKGGEFIEGYNSDKTDPLFNGETLFPFDEVFQRLDGEPDLNAPDRTMTSAEVGKLLHDLMLWITATKAHDHRAIKSIGTKALVAAWILNPKLVGDVPGRTVAKLHGLHHEKFSRKAAEFSRNFCIQNQFQAHDGKNPRRKAIR